MNKMIRLTKMFKINARFGSIVEIYKNIGNNKVVIPFSSKDVKIDENGYILITLEAFNKHLKFFRTATNY